LIWRDVKQHGDFNHLSDIIEKDFPIPFLILIERLFALQIPQKKQKVGSSAMQITRLFKKFCFSSLEFHKKAKRRLIRDADYSSFQKV